MGREGCHDIETSRKVRDSQASRCCDQGAQEVGAHRQSASQELQVGCRRGAHWRGRGTVDDDRSTALIGYSGSGIRQHLGCSRCRAERVAVTRKTLLVATARWRRSSPAKSVVVYNRLQVRPPPHLKWPKDASMRRLQCAGRLGLNVGDRAVNAGHVRHASTFRNSSPLLDALTASPGRPDLPTEVEPSQPELAMARVLPTEPPGRGTATAVAMPATAQPPKRPA